MFCNEGVRVSGDFIGHVDLFPTITALVGHSIPDGTPSYDLTAVAPDDRLVYNGIEHSFLGRELVRRQSVWDPTGGYVFTD